MNYEPKPLPFSKQLDGISEKTLQTHHDKLYVGYVKKLNELAEKFKAYVDAGNFEEANATYSDLRSMKDAETFATNGVYLHEWYFDVLGGAGDWQVAPELTKALEEKWGSIEKAVAYMSACAMAARGWMVICWDTRVGKLKQYNADAHAQGGVWGCLPIIVLDVYEHAYFIDYGSDRKSYIEAYWKNFNWGKAEEMFKKVRGIVI